MKILSAIFILLLALQAGHAQDYEFVAVPKGTDVSKLFGPVWVGTATGTLNLAGNPVTNVGTLTASNLAVSGTATVLGVFTNGSGSARVEVQSSNAASLRFTASANGNCYIVGQTTNSYVVVQSGGAGDRLIVTPSGAVQLQPLSVSPLAIQGGIYFESDAPVGFYRCTNGTTWTAF